LKTKIIILYLLILTSVYPQLNSNYEIITKLIDKSLAESTNSFVTEDEVLLSVFSPQPLEVLKPYIAQKMINMGYLVKSGTSGNLQLTYTILDVKVEYGEAFGSLFGELKTERTITLQGTSSIIKEGTVLEPRAFNLSNSDTVEINNIQSIENQTIPFTKGVPPSLSVYSNLLEPIIVVGTLIATVILLFTVRSK
jgi:hypothetical protein